MAKVRVAKKRTIKALRDVKALDQKAAFALNLTVTYEGLLLINKWTAKLTACLLVAYQIVVLFR